MSFKKMYKKMPGVLKRTVWAKSIGGLISLIGFIMIIKGGYYTQNPMFAWGILLWYPTVGSIIGLAGVMDKHPLLGHMGFWRGVALGGVMNLVLILLSFDSAMMLASSAGYNFSSSGLIFGAIIEGAIVGGLIDWYVTKKFGEGKKLMK